MREKQLQKIATKFVAAPFALRALNMFHFSYLPYTMIQPRKLWHVNDFVLGQLLLSLNLKITMKKKQCRKKMKTVAKQRSILSLRLLISVIKDFFFTDLFFTFLKCFIANYIIQRIQKISKSNFKRVKTFIKT